MELIDSHPAIVIASWLLISDSLYIILAALAWICPTLCNNVDEQVPQTKLQ